jgi:putative SOS response-associated peptidase YedK
LTDKSFFAAHADRHRCAVPADGFYERQRSGAPPWLFRLKSSPVFSLAGLLNDDGELVVLTTTPNACVRRVHNRMPVILLGGTLDAWLDPERPFQALPQTFAAPWQETDTTAFPPPPSPQHPLQSELF